LLQIQSNATCFGSATGAVTLDVQGETGNLLQWSVDGINWNSFIAGNQIAGIPAGVAPTFNRVISVSQKFKRSLQRSSYCPNWPAK